MKYIILFLFMGLSVMGHSQIRGDVLLGTKNGCIDSDRITTEDAVNEFLKNNDSFSESYKEAYLIAWRKCRYESCSWDHSNSLIDCDDNLPGPGTTPRPRSEDQNEQP